MDDDDVRAVMDALRSDWLTTGPKVPEFERAFAAVVGAPEAVAVANGTAALHAMMYGIGIGPGDEVLVPAMTFAATANAVVFQGGRPVFVDVAPDTLLIDPEAAEARITPRTRAIVAVDYAGQPCDYVALHAVAGRHGLRLVADACHALGGSFYGRPVGSLAELSAFSLHPVKHVTAGEGGVVATADPVLAERMRMFRNHGIRSDYRERERRGTWFYEMVDLGFNYRVTDFQCALALSQLRKLDGWVTRRQQIAQRYDEAFDALGGVRPLAVAPGAGHAYHLYVVRLDRTIVACDRATFFAALRAEGIGVNVHYVPVHLHPYYRERFGTGPGVCPVAEAAYEDVLSLPMFPGMTEADVEDVVSAVSKVVRAYRR